MVFKENVVFNYFSENHHEFWDLGVQIARSPRPEGVRRCPIACWKATFMYFTKIQTLYEKSFFEKYFSIGEKYFSDFHKNFKKFLFFRKFSGFSENFKISKPKIFTDRKLFFKKL